MKKENYQKRLAERRHYNEEKRKAKPFKSEKQIKFARHLFKVEDRILKKKRSSVFSHFSKNGYFDSLEESKFISFPKIFSLTENFDESFSKIILAIYSYEVLNGENLKLSFNKCVKVELTCLFILDNLFGLIYRHKLRMQNSFNKKLNNTIEFIRSKNVNVNKRLCVFSNRFVFELDSNDTELIPISKRTYSGSRSSKSYVESSKKIATTKIRDFIKNTLNKATSFELTDAGVNHFEGLISETIDNSEQHSFYGGEWFATTYLFEDSTIALDDKVVEIQIHFMNFGVSIYESLYKHRLENKEMFDVLNDITNKIMSKTTVFKEENLLTLLALNEGVSCLHFEDESRGTGTIKLLESFFQIGDYENMSRDIHPLMIILSGETLIKIDNKYKCYRASDSGKINVSLNESKNISNPPSKSHLINLNKKFPGTLISLRVYLNEHNLQTKSFQKK